MRILHALGGALTVLLLVASAAAPVRGEEETFRIATGTEGGVYQRVGIAIAEILRGRGGPDGIAFQSVTSTGSVTNVQRVVRGDTELAIIQGDVLFHACRGTLLFQEPQKNLRAVCVLYPEVIHILARPGAGIQGLADLRGRRVAVGERGSGTAVSAGQILAAAGLGDGSIERLQTSAAAAREGLLAGTIDACFVAAPASATAIAELLAQGATLVSVDAETSGRVTREDPYLSARELAAGTYPGQARAVAALAVDAILATGEDAPSRSVADVVTRLFDGAAKLRAALPPGAEVLPERAAASLPMPLHRGAMTFFESRGQIERPIKVSTSLFLHDVWNFDVKAGTFDVDFEVWFKWHGRLDAENDAFRFEVMNGVINSSELEVSEKAGVLTAINYRVRATLRGNFQMQNYPFDKQLVRIEIEHPNMNVAQLRFLPDIQFGDNIRNLRLEGIDPTLTIEDWWISDVRQEAFEHTFPTDFGSISKPGVRVTYSRYRFELELRRIVLPYVIKFSVPLVIIVLMCFVVFWMHPEQFDAKVVTVITALLSSIAFHVSQADHLPSVGYLVAADKFFILSYGVIFLTLVECVIENRFVREEQMDRAWRLMRWSQVLFPALFFLPIAYLIYMAQS